MNVYNNIKDNRVSKLLQYELGSMRKARERTRQSLANWANNLTGTTLRASSVRNTLKLVGSEQVSSNDT